MRTILSLLVGISLLAGPANAAEFREPSFDTRAGAFVGVRVKFGAVHSEGIRPSAELALAPTLTRTTSAGFARTRIADGVALNLAGPKPALTIAGIPADRYFASRGPGAHRDGRKLGISTTGLVVGGVVLAAAIGAAVWFNNYLEEDRRSD